MPTSDFDGSAGWGSWLQSLLANQGANQPYGPGAAGIGLGGHLPTWGAVAGYSQATPGAPSMGYPAVGQAAGRPSVAPGTQQPAPSAPWFQFGGFHPENILQSHPPGSASLGHFPVNSALPPGAADSLPLAFGNPTLNDYNNWLQSQMASAQPAPAPAPAAAPTSPGGAQMGMPFPQDLGPAARNMPYPGQTDPRGYYAPPPGPLAANQPTQATGPIDPSIIARRKMAASPAATSTAPPSAAPSQSPLFTPVQRPNMPAAGYRGGDPMMSALNLARLFGRG